MNNDLDTTINKVKHLMGFTQLSEAKQQPSNNVQDYLPCEDGNIYGIIKENHKYVIKVCKDKNNIIAENFNYIGGFRNKKKNTYDSYTNATKQLELKIKTINEAHGVFENKHMINLDKKEDLVLECADNMKKEIMRQRELMLGVLTENTNNYNDKSEEEDYEIEDNFTDDDESDEFDVDSADDFFSNGGFDLFESEEEDYEIEDALDNNDESDEFDMDSADDFFSNGGFDLFESEEEEDYEIEDNFTDDDESDEFDVDSADDFFSNGGFDLFESEEEDYEIEDNFTDDDESDEFDVDSADDFFSNGGFDLFESEEEDYEISENDIIKMVESTVRDIKKKITEDKTILKIPTKKKKLKKLSINHQ